MISAAEAYGALVPVCGNKGQTHYILQDEVYIGRCEKSIICLKNPRISRQHCVIKKTNANIFTICDLSTHGTYVNNILLLRMNPQRLEDKDIISFPPLETNSYMLKINRSIMDGYPSKQRDELCIRMDQERSCLENSQCDEITKLNNEISRMKTKKTDLQEEMNAKVKVQENLFDKERMSLKGLVAMTKEQKEEAEKKLIEMEIKSKEEREKLMLEVESKLEEFTKKEEELRQLKEEVEMRHVKERDELEKRYEMEISDLKTKLGLSELEQDRLQGEAQEAQLKLAETKQTLVDCEIEQTRLCHEVIDLTKESTSKDEVVQDLEKKLKEKEVAAEKWRQDMEGLEEHLQCTICVELFIDPTVLNCGHMFCLVCIEEWKRKKKICPMCRNKITNCMRIFHLDTIIEKHIALLPLEARERRETLIKQRLASKSQIPVPAKKRKCNHRYNMPEGYQLADEDPNSPYPRIRVYLAPPSPEHGEEADAIDLSTLMPLATAPFLELSHHHDHPLHVNQADPFAFREGTRQRAPATSTQTSDFAVSVAAIDLTNLSPVVSTSTIGQRTRSATASNSSLVSSTSSFVDLTSP